MKQIAPILLFALLSGCMATTTMKQKSVHILMGEEYIPSDEAEQIDQIVAIHREVQEHVDRKLEPVPRGQHPKQHGCVRAIFVVEPHLPANLRHGIFSEPRSYQALIRFSNGKQSDDRLPDAHGMAIKLLGVDGEKVLATEKNARTQDFIMIDHPVFFVRNVADYVPLMRDFRRLSMGNMFSKGATGLKFLFSPNYKHRILRQTAAKRPDSPLAIRYWSTTPSKLGPLAMKFSARSAGTGGSPAARLDSKDKLRLALSEHLMRHEARFDFLVQIQTDPVTMPVEDPTVLWDEAASPYIKVATIRIPVQSFESDEQMALGENLSYTPWHSLPDHRPLGGINRARREVYEAIAARRHELNGVPMHEPDDK